MPSSVTDQASTTNTTRSSTATSPTSTVPTTVQDSNTSSTKKSAATTATTKDKSKGKKSKTLKPITSDRPILTFPDPMIAVHRIQWSCNERSSRWLVFGGCLGLLQLVKCK